MAAKLASPIDLNLRQTSDSEPKHKEMKHGSDTIA
jgi:hypothetical protein